MWLLRPSLAWCFPVRKLCFAAVSVFGVFCSRAGHVVFNLFGKASDDTLGSFSVLLCGFSVGPSLAFFGLPCLVLGVLCSRAGHVVFSFYTLHFTLHTVHFLLHSILDTLRSTLCTLHSTLHTFPLHFTLYTPHSTIPTSHSTHYIPHSTLDFLRTPPMLHLRGRRAAALQ